MLDGWFQTIILYLAIMVVRERLLKGRQGILGEYYLGYVHRFSKS